MQDITKLEGRLGLTFTDKDLITQALVHRSYLNEHPGFKLGHNERLEFLGDAVLELVVTEHLFQHFPNPEGELTNWRAALVNATMLAGIAAGLGLEEHLLLSHGEAKDKDSKARQYILANAIEAVIGAVYLDQGYAAVKAFVERTVLVELELILKDKLYLDPKSAFQEAAQEFIGVTPSYKVLEEQGPDHAKEFVVGVYLGSELVAKGRGTSKQEAQVQAAKEALSVKSW
jgi:ribonuclease III